jgi:uncharacterized membrane protein (DUF373 family)
MQAWHKWLNNSLPETRRYWPGMDLYQRFEQMVALILSVVIAALVVVALLELMGRIGQLFVTGAFDPLNHQVFQNVFGAIMTLLIAMEFKHSILRVARRQGSIVEVKTVVLITILALSRKLIIVDLGQIDAGELAALAAVILALGIVYWLMRERDDFRVRSEESADAHHGREQRRRLDLTDRAREAA